MVYLLGSLRRQTSEYFIMSQWRFVTPIAISLQTSSLKQGVHGIHGIQIQIPIYILESLYILVFKNQYFYNSDTNISKIGILISL